MKLLLEKLRSCTAIVAGVVRPSTIARRNEPPPLFHTHREPDTTISL